MCIDHIVEIAGPSDFGEWTGDRREQWAMAASWASRLSWPDHHRSGELRLRRVARNKPRRHSEISPWRTWEVTPGTYHWTWGGGVDADSFMLADVGVAAPEPATLSLLGAGLAGVCFMHADAKRIDQSGSLGVMPTKVGIRVFASEDPKRQCVDAGLRRHVAPGGGVSARRW